MDIEKLARRLAEIGDLDFRAVWKELGSAGFFEIFRDSSTIQEGCMALEELGYHYPQLGVFISIISSCGLALPILEAGDPDGAFSTVFEDTLRGDAVIAVAITERGAGSDVYGMKSELVEEHGSLVLRGSKWSITNAPVADYVVVFCQNRTGPTPFLSAVLVDTKSEGVRVGEALDLAGAHGSPTGELFFDDVSIDSEQVLGRPEHGKIWLDLAFSRERLLAPWPLLGKMAKVIQDGLDYVSARHQFGKQIGSFQYVQGRLVDAYSDYESVRLVALEAVQRYAETGDADLHGSLAKYRTAEVAASVFRSLVELHGSYGIQTEARLSQYVIDALCASIAGGTREIHRKVIYDQLVLDRSRSRRGRESLVFPLSHRAKQAPEEESS